MNINNNEELLSAISNIRARTEGKTYDEVYKIRSEVDREFIDFFGKKYFYTKNFPRPVYYETKALKEGSRKVPEYANFNGIGSYSYFDIPGVGRTALYKDVVKMIGTKFAVYNGNYNNFTFSIYAKELDVVLTFTAQPEGSKYIIVGLKVYFRKGSPIKSYTFGECSGASFRKGPIFHGPFGEAESISHAFKKMYGVDIVNIRTNEYVRIWKSFNEFMEFKGPKKTNGKRQKLVDELCSYKLPEIKFSIDNKRRWNDLFTVTVVNKVKENTSVLRWAVYDKINKEYVDTLRIYSVNNEYVSCKRNECGEFINYPVSKLCLENFRSDYMLPIEKCDVEGTSFLYYYNIINGMPEQSKSIALLAFIRNPRLEQMSKIGLSTLVSRIVNKRNDSKIKEALHQTLLTKEDKKNVLQYLGLNSYQVSKFGKLLDDTKDDYYNKNDNAIFILKTIIFLTDDLSSIDNDTFDIALNFVAHWEKGNTYILRSITTFLQKKDEKMYRNFIVNSLPKFIDEKDSYKTSGNLRLFDDYLDMVKRLDAFGELKLTFDNMAHLQQMHDIAVDVYNTKQYQEYAEGFSESVKKIAKYEYKPKDSKFVVVAPKTPMEVAKEGIELHHCVKSYIPRIVEGTTNIMFIRKNDDLDKPFFTVEVSNDKTIEQVHGLSNRNADTEPGLTEFVESWAKKKKLELKTIDKVR